MQCEAKSKQSGERCKRHAARGKNKCVIHGGASPTGAASPQFKHGRYSRDLPTRLAARYHEAQTDPELLALREEIALVDSRLADLLLRVDSGEAGHWWKELKRIYGDYREAERKADIPATKAALTEWGGIVQVGVSDYAAWGEIYNVVEQRRKLVESERKRLVEMSQVITAEKAMLLISALIDIVRRNVADPSTLAKISADVRALIAKEPDSGSGANEKR